MPSQLPDLRGTYVLVFQVERPLVNRLGRFHGRYAYVGSAFGPGGIRSRVERHLRKTKKVHWHIDLLSESESFRPERLYYTPNRVECKLAYELSKLFEGVEGFGASDCSCPTHLFKLPSEAVKMDQALASFGLQAVSLDHLSRLGEG